MDGLVSPGTGGAKGRVALGQTIKSASADNCQLSVVLGKCLDAFEEQVDLEALVGAVVAIVRQTQV